MNVSNIPKGFKLYRETDKIDGFSSNDKLINTKEKITNTDFSKPGTYYLVKKGKMARR